MMDAITALHTRVSVSRVTEPGPDEATLDNICRAALRAADHAMLRPWRFLRLQGDARERLGELFALAQRHDDPHVEPRILDDARSKALRAPLIVVGIVSPKDHPNVPVAEQHLSAGAAMQNMLVAAHAQNVGAIWRTGAMATHPVVTEGLGLTGDEQIIGFLYLGTISGPVRPLPDETLDDYFQDW